MAIASSEDWSALSVRFDELARTVGPIPHVLALWPKSQQLPADTFGYRVCQPSSFRMFGSETEALLAHDSAVEFEWWSPFDSDSSQREMVTMSNLLDSAGLAMDPTKSDPVADFVNSRRRWTAFLHFFLKGNCRKVEFDFRDAQAKVEWPHQWGVMGQWVEQIKRESSPSRIMDVTVEYFLSEYLDTKAIAGAMLRYGMLGIVLDDEHVGLSRGVRYSVVTDLNRMAAQACRELAVRGRDVDRKSGGDAKSVKPQSDVAMRSWTQQDLNAAIIEYKAKRASTYQDLVAGVQAGRPGAIKSARKMFGRNAIKRKLGVKSPAMVTNSPAWKAIAEELQLLRGKDRNNRKMAKVGLDMAMEDSASDTAMSQLDLAEQRETIDLIKKAMAPEAAELLIERLKRGDMSDDKAREIVQAATEQKRDDRSRKIPRKP